MIATEPGQKICGDFLVALGLNYFRHDFWSLGAQKQLARPVISS
jgi:hypothetical protein